MTKETIDPYRNLLVAALNKLIEEKHISLAFDGTNKVDERGHVFVELFNQNSVILWRNVGFGELLISVWWKYDPSKHPQANLEGNERESFNLDKPLAKTIHYRKFVGIVASCWLERKTSKHIQGKNREHISVHYSRRGELKILKELPVQKPNEYEISGRFYF
jgi:hypothetical protein